MLKEEPGDMTSVTLQYPAHWRVFYFGESVLMRHRWWKVQQLRLALLIIMQVTNVIISINQSH